MDVQLHDVIDSRVEPADFECDYEGHKKLPGDAIHLFEAAVHRFLRPEALDLVPNPNLVKAVTRQFNHRLSAV